MKAEKQDKPEAATIISTSPEQTLEAAGKLARRIRGGAIIGLCGPLGAGKTLFVRGLVKGLGGDSAEVSSPTFTLIREYALPQRRTFYHVDFYRLDTIDEADRLGLEEIIGLSSSIIAVEWAERFESFLPPGSLWTYLDEDPDGADPSRRILRITQTPPSQMPGFKAPDSPNPVAGEEVSA